MQEQGKRLIVAVGLALVVFLLYTKYLAPKPKPPEAGSGAGSGALVTGSAAAAGSTAVDPTRPRAHAGDDAFHGPAPAPAPETTLPAAPKLHFPAFDVEFSNAGGGIAGWHLSDPRYEKVLDPDGKSKNEGQLLPVTIPGASSLQVNYERDDGSVLIPPHALWTPKQLDDHTVQYDLDTPDLHVTKTFTIVPDAYMVKLTVSTTFKTAATGNALVTPVLTTYGFQDPKTDDAGSSRVQPRVWQSATLADGDVSATAGIKIGTSFAPDSSPRKATHVQWTGFSHPFLLAAIAPQPSPDEDIRKHTEAIDPAGLMRTDIYLKQVSAQPGPPTVRTAVAYFGPKNYDLLDGADTVAGFATGFRDTIDFGHLPGLGLSLALIGKPLLWLLQQFYNAVGNWGVAIVLLTLCVKIVTLFWTTRSMRSMKAMAALSPQIQELNTKYGDDKARIQQETMALYKQHGVSPLAGCAPMFLQIPIWSALYIMLSATGELYQQPFIPGWINDLTNSDPTHVLPVLLVATMFLQARLTPQTANQPGAKMMQYGMPLMFGVMSFYFPAGLSLYIFTNTVLSSLHSIYMNKFDKKSLEIAEQLKRNKAAVEARAKAAEELAKAQTVTGGAGGKKKKGATTTVETPAVEAAGDSDSADDAVSASASTGSGQPRPRRKKRRR